MRWLFAASIILIAGCATPQPTDDTDPPATPEAITSYAWRTNTTEPVAHGVLFETHESGWCKMLWAGAGKTPDYADTFMTRLDEGDVLFQRLGRGPGTIPETHASAQAAGNEQHVNEGHAWADSWSVNRTYMAAQQVNLTIAAMHLAAPDPPASASGALGDHTAILTVDCSMPIKVLGEWHGTDVVIFSETTFSGGASAHVHGLGETGAQAANRVVMNTDAPIGWLFLDYRGDLLLQHIAAGVITINTPEGEHIIADHPAALALAVAGLNSLQYEVRSGPGDYSAEVTYASVDILGDVQGFMLGLVPLSP